MQIQHSTQQQQQQLIKTSKNKCKKQFVGCSFGFCTTLIKFSNGRISNYLVLSIKEPPKCPAIGLFPPLSENKNYIQIIGKQLFNEMKQLINNIELAIIKLEQINTKNNLLKDINNSLEIILINKGMENKKNENNNYLLIEQFVLQVKELFELARKIEKIIPSFFEELCCDCPLVDEEICSEQILSKQFAKILEASIRFDTLKVITPTLQNAFSLFRRMCLLKNEENNIYNLNAPLSDQIALFLSRPSPLFTALVNSTEHFIYRQKCKELATSHLIEAFIVIYNVMKKMFYRLCQNNQEIHLNIDYRKEFLLRSMMGILLITDHIDKNNGGIFIPSNSSFDICNFIELVKMGSTLEETNKILATLRFMSKHFSDLEIPFNYY
ncbi:hypothetical protein Mgra_00009373 [Meloidogyne graminicola]|uniref:CYRIA/CYRIB Rac1 binding domain-containing protein n=1 Tax=Meloidogyne graminicola TaxID=189291 RepID=A0A8S9ZBS9_9BILA|nr:hypothetical protein Mgra_00009373 [Meloidogyne graminicola]